MFCTTLSFSFSFFQLLLREHALNTTFKDHELKECSGPVPSSGGNDYMPSIDPRSHGCKLFLQNIPKRTLALVYTEDASMKMVGTVYMDLPKCYPSGFGNFVAF